MEYSLSVSALNEQIKALVETSFEFISVEGELSRITNHGSGHIYFTLKDSESSIKCVMFRGNAAKLKFRLEEGSHVILHGAISLYKPRGEYQINVVSIEPYGVGALSVAFEQLKSALAAKGYFASERKKPLPKFPKVIAIITSSTGAALQDMIKVASHRWPLISFIVIDVLVQGDRAASQIASALYYADNLQVDAIVLGRGGGSIEDLWAFNEEKVADALFSIKTPTISAVGHEIDWVISDFVSDMRAPTPSAAMQILLPDQNELLMSLDEMKYRFTQILTQRMMHWKDIIKRLNESYKHQGIEYRLEMQKKSLNELSNAFNRQIRSIIEKQENLIATLKEQFNYQTRVGLNRYRLFVDQLQKNLENNNPNLKHKRGYAQLAQQGKVIDLKDINKDDIFDILNNEYRICAKALAKERLI